MTTEVQTEAIEDAPPVVLAEEATTSAPAKKLTKRPAETKAEAPVKIEPAGISPEMRETMRANDKSIKSMIESFAGGTFKIRITRKEPDEIQDPNTGKWIPCGGFLKEVDTEIDEEWIQRKFGGGKYELEFKKPGPKGGYVYGGLVTATIAGEPNIAELPRAVKRDQQTAQAPGANGENPSLIKEAFGFMKEQVAAAQAQANPKSGPDDAVLQFMQKQLEAEQRKSEALMREMRELRESINRPQPKSAEENVTQKMLDKLIDGDSARITALRAQYDSEIRALNEARREDERRFHDRLERELAQLRMTHERELATLRTAQEVALQAVRSSSEVQVSSSKSAFDTQMALAKSENDRLRSENSELRAEVKDLRAKKEKSPVEMIKDMQTIKEALGVEDEDDEPKGAVAQIAEAMTNPGTWEGIASVLGRAKGQQEQAQPEQQGPQRKRRVVKVNGKKMIMEADGRTFSELPPAKQADGQSGPQMPDVDPTIIGHMVQLMEGAFEAGQDPAIVAQGARSRIPEDVLTAIRDHGVDAVMTKMAKLSSTSPLSSQRGRQWVRALGEALVG